MQLHTLAFNALRNKASALMPMFMTNSEIEKANKNIIPLSTEEENKDSDKIEINVDQSVDVNMNNNNGLVLASDICISEEKFNKNITIVK